VARGRKSEVEQSEDDASAAADDASDAAVDAESEQKPAKKRAQASRARKAASTATDDAEDAGTVEAEDEARRARLAAAMAASEAGVADEDDPLLDTAIRQIEAGATDEKPFGEPGAPISPRSPFKVAFAAAWGVLTALLIAKAIVDARQVLVLIAVGAFLAIGLNPAVEFLQRKGMRRGRAVLVVIGALLLFFVGFLAAAVPAVTSQASDLVEKFPEYLEDLRKNPTFSDLDKKYDLVDKAKNATKDGLSVNALGGVLGVAKGIFNAFFTTFTVLILTMYFLGSYPNLKRSAYRLIPRSRRPRVGLLADEILARVGGYVLGNIATSAIAGLAALVFLLALGVPYPVALAMLVALLDLIPLIGATIAAVVCTLVALFGVSVPIGLITLAIFLAYQQFENYVLVPRVMKRTVDVAPVVTIIAVLIGGTLLGVVGALLAIPVAAALQLIATEVWYPKQDTA
jgi:predicted PurR-regulated permease PerM